MKKKKKKETKLLLKVDSCVYYKAKVISDICEGGLFRKSA